jgi:predicted exporter
MMTNAPQRRRRGQRVLVSGLLFGLLSIFVASRFVVTADITHFLPDADDRALAALSRQIMDSELSRTLILAVETPDLATSLVASRAFEAALRAEPRVADAVLFLEGGPAEGVDRALFELYEPRGLSFLAASEEEARARLNDEGLREAARRLRAELAGPLSSMVSRVAPSDPFLTVPALFRRLELARSSDVTLVDGRFVTEDGRTALFFLGTRASALDARAQAPFLAGIQDAFEAVASQTSAPIRLDQSGVHRMATRTAETIEADIKRVSMVSSGLLVVLLLALFRSLRLVALAAVPIAFGVLSGSAFVLLMFGRIHGITLAFGAALIGVSIDYVVHLYCHDSIVAPPGGPAVSLRAIIRPLSTGAMTTIVGFLALAASNLSGLREIASFSVVGLIAAFLASVFLVPAFMSDRESQSASHERWAAFIERIFLKLEKRRSLLLLLPLGAVFVIGWGLPRAGFNPDLASMGRMDPEILAEEERVRSKVMQFEQTRFVVALGDTEAEALEANDAAAEILNRAIEQSELGAQRSLASLLPSPRTQLAIAEVAKADAELPNRLRAAFDAEGFASGAFEPFIASIQNPLPAPLDFDLIANSPAASLVRPFRVRLGERVGILTFLHDVRSAEAVAERLSEIPNVLFFQQSDLWAEAQLEYQRSTAKLLAGGLLAVLLILAARYRDLRRTLIAFVPSVLSAAVTVAVLALAGRGLDLISLTALLFVVSLGVDYSVFLVDANDEDDPKSVAAALTGALLAGMSTVVAFGLLSLSAHPVLSGLGLTAAVGIGTSLLLAPTVLILLQPKEASTDSLPLKVDE